MTNEVSTPESLAQPQPPKITLLTMFRLGLYQMGLGMMSLLTLGVLNRVMIKELAIPALIAALIIAAHQFMSPARVWFGQMSDQRRVLKMHRTGYIWIGTGFLAVCSFLLVQSMWQFGASVYADGGGSWSAGSYGWAFLLAGVSAAYGLTLSAGSTPFAALLVDISDDEERSRLIGVVWSMLMVGIVIGAITISNLLPPAAEATTEITKLSLFARPDELAALQAGVNRIFVIIPLVVLGLAVIATFGIEPKYSRFRARLEQGDRVEREDQITFGRAFKVLTSNRQTGIFFGFLLLLTLGIFMQDPVLEPYGGDLFGMSVSDTAKLNAFSGSGTLVSIALAGFLIVPRIGKNNTAQVGCISLAVSLALLMVSGTIGNPMLLKLVMLIFGIASGIATTGALSLMLDLTAVETAGTFIGAWGLAQAMARGLATVFGGGLLNLGKGIFVDNLLTAYGLVFICQIMALVAAIVLLQRVNVKEFKASAEEAIATLMAGDLD
ncbi:PUCC protein [Thalassoporum mexicanum PCC 7367]|uniref:BCD family MFS transporter n=1 Tax=Thalassoporum mexicanum TaxID=3457544 RepID=UPI00029FCA57|nr:BCD family MFS transporter [Pseudanabaena sp. PCC 7367]AFY71744.1 PUCC protein [Pseudanabaena sp. PCC 7367]